MSAAAWRSRIVREGEVAPGDLLANPHNWRIHPRHQQAAMEGVLDDVGWVQRVIVNQRTGHMVDGHLRVTLALRRDEPTIPVLYVDLDEREEALVLATLDPMAGLAVADREQLGLLLDDVHTGDAAVMEVLADVWAGSGHGAVLGLDDAGDRRTTNNMQILGSGDGDIAINFGDIMAVLPRDVYDAVASVVLDRDRWKTVADGAAHVLRAGVTACSK